MKKRLRIIITAFFISFLFMAGLSFFSIERFDAVIKYSDQVDHTNSIMHNLYSIEGHVRDIDRTERGFMLTHDTMYVRLLHAHIDSLYSQTRKLKNLITASKTEKQNLILLRSELAVRISIAQQNISYIDTAHSQGLSPFFEQGRQAMLNCMKKLREIQHAENATLSESSRQEHFYQQLASDTLKYLLVIFFILTVGIFILLIRELKKRLKYQDELQVKLLDLKRSHSELEQIAYAASHDLQEPLRKIQVFSNRLLWMNKNLDSDSKETMQRLTIAANRMQNLIEDLVNLTSLTKNGGTKEPVDLATPILKAIDDLNKKIVQKNATIDFGTMPVIDGYVNQLYILFKALLDNSLKFSRENVSPVIHITSEVVTGDELIDINSKLLHKKFYRITFTDNGIGFDNKFAHKMFQIFQRLHNQQSDYDGKGIGLAICQRVMANHEGYILAYGHPEIGATFKLFFPTNED